MTLTQLGPDRWQLSRDGFVWAVGPRASIEALAGPIINLEELGL